MAIQVWIVVQQSVYVVQLLLLLLIKCVPCTRDTYDEGWGGSVVNVCIESKYRVSGRWLPTKDDCMEFTQSFDLHQWFHVTVFFSFFLYQIIPYIFKVFIYSRCLYLKITSCTPCTSCTSMWWWITLYINVCKRNYSEMKVCMLKARWFI